MNTFNAAEVAANAKYTVLKNGGLMVEGAAIKFTNFAGNPTQFNTKGGVRTFNLVLSEDMGRYLESEGWNVKPEPPYREGDLPSYRTEIVVKMDSQWPPIVKLYSKFNGRKKIETLDEFTIGQLDNLRHSTIDLVINPSKNKKGYLKSMEYFSEASKNYFDEKYKDWAEEASYYDSEEPVPFN